MAEPKQQVSFLQSKASVTLDAIRAIAATLVLLSHWKIMFFVDYGAIPSHRAWFWLPYRVMEAGRQAVLIFFVLSGYLISSSVFRLLDRGQWRWPIYLTHRLVRLWVVLIPGLLLSGLWDWIGLHYGHGPTIYDGTGSKSHGINLVHALTWPTLAGNLAFLQTIFVPAFGSNGALWSLANEFWYYILFPLGWLALRQNTPASRRLFYLLLLLPLAWMLRSSILRLFPVWLDGTLLALIPPPRVGRLARIVAVILYLPLIFVFANLHTGHGYREDFVFGAITLLFFWIMLSATERSTNSFSTRLARHTARFSFTLYIVHMPALALIAAMTVGATVYAPTDLHHGALALGVLLLLIAYSWFFASLTEFRTDQVRAWAESLVNRANRLLRNDGRMPQESLTAGSDQC